MIEQIDLFNCLPVRKSEDRTALVRASMDTMKLFDQLDDRYGESVLFEDNEPSNRASDYEQDGAGIIQVVDADVLEVAQIFSGNRPCLLNFGNAHYPGGGWLSGAVAQEESIARRSSLVKSIRGNRMYERNKAYTETPFYLDDMIYSPHVRVLKDLSLNRLPKEDEFDVAIVTGAAVNMKSLYIENTYKVQLQVKAIMERRIAKVLDIMAGYGHRCIILGAWGCGAFGQDVDSVSRCFHDVLFSQRFAWCFDNIVFAIYKDAPKIDAFRNAFAGKLFDDLAAAHS